MRAGVTIEPETVAKLADIAGKQECNLGLSQIRQFHRVRMISEGYGCLTWWDVRIGGSFLLMKWNPLEGKIILKIVRNKRSSQTSKKSEKVPTMLLSTSWLITPLISHEPVPLWGSKHMPHRRRRF